jgi:hypothetical protein
VPLILLLSGDDRFTGWLPFLPDPSCNFSNE